MGQLKNGHPSSPGRRGWRSGRLETVSMMNCEQKGEGEEGLARLTKRIRVDDFFREVNLTRKPGEVALALPTSGWWARTARPPPGRPLRN